MSPRRTPPDAWRPAGIDALEPNALAAVRDGGCACVVAGPGAGKTEFLAQRAAFLLQTGTCPPPYQILAISFKRDAAQNLASRVRERCAPEHAARFASMTFDAFAKGLVDRFRAVIPTDWRPPPSYLVALPSSRTIATFLADLRTPREAWTHEVRGLRALDFEPQHFGLWHLPAARPEPTSGLDYARLQWWDFHTRAAGGARFTFTMLNRLAELVVRTHGPIRRALRATYPFVFVDEFQDSTYAQFDLLETLFLGTSTAVTTVGDNKQRIMVWAGARSDAFARFAAEFNAPTVPLTFNFRSSPDLVRLQHVVAQALDDTVLPARAQAPSKVRDDVAQRWAFRTETQEAAALAAWLRTDRVARHLGARDYAIVVRQKAEPCYDRLRGPFAAAGLRLRNESRVVGRTTLQDLMGEPLTLAALALLELGVEHRAPAAWMTATRFLHDVRAVAPDDGVAAERVERALTGFVQTLRRDLLASPPSRTAAASVLSRIVAYLGPDALARTIPEYALGDGLAIATEALGKHLAASADAAGSWEDCLARCRGIDETPLLTIHKSKGLEYDTVIFLDLDDDAWWNHTPGDAEGTSAFFVALSRAKQRVIFTHCQERGGRNKVSDLYLLLERAGVPERRW